MTFLTKHISLLFLSFGLLFLQNAAYACTVCFSGADQDMTRGFFWGILMLLILPFTLMGGLVGYIVYSVRKKRLS